MAILNLSRPLVSAWRITHREIMGGIKPIRNIIKVWNTLPACHFQMGLLLGYFAEKILIWEEFPLTN